MLGLMAFGCAAMLHAKANAMTQKAIELSPGDETNGKLWGGTATKYLDPDPREVIKLPEHQNTLTAATLTDLVALCTLGLGLWLVIKGVLTLRRKEVPDEEPAT
jgi:hypothetical protein